MRQDWESGSDGGHGAIWKTKRREHVRVHVPGLPGPCSEARQGRGGLWPTSVFLVRSDRAHVPGEFRNKGHVPDLDATRNGGRLDEAAIGVRRMVLTNGKDASVATLPSVVRSGSGNGGLGAEIGF